jgi:hypothetical protein
MVNKPRYMLVDARSDARSKRLGSRGWVAWDRVRDVQAGLVTTLESADAAVDELNAQG